MDRLWMRGLMAVAGVFLLVVLGYFAALFEMQSKRDRARAELASLGTAYTNALGDDTQIKLLTERQYLKYASLDCWMAVAESLPANLTLDTFYFNGLRVDLSGTGSTEQPDDIYAFHDGLRQAQDVRHSGLLFSEVSPPTTQVQGNRMLWRFTCTLRSSEAP
jgi:hypothetical protein